MRKKIIFLTLAATLSSHQSITFAADAYPSRPIRVITAVGPGGTADIFLRTLGEELTRRWGQPIVVEPHPGGNFVIGGRACAEAPADGHTLCMLSGETLAYNMFLFKSLPYDPEKNFVPITNFFFTTTAVVVNAGLNVKSLDELAALARAKPQRVFFDKFNRERGTDLVGIPFRGGAEAVAGVLSGWTPVAFFGLASFLPYLRAGTMNGLLVDGAVRSPLVPEIATLAETGYRDNLTRVYYGLVAPAGVAASIVHRLREEIADIMSVPGFRQRNLIERALEPIANTPEEFARFLQQDRLLSQQVVREAGLQPQ